MKITTKSTVTITMSGAQAHRLSVQLYDFGADRAGGPAEELLDALRELPEEVDE